MDTGSTVFKHGSVCLFGLEAQKSRSQLSSILKVDYGGTLGKRMALVLAQEEGIGELKLGQDIGT